MKIKSVLLLSLFVSALISCDKISTEELESYPVMLLEGAFIGEPDTTTIMGDTKLYSYSEEKGYVFYPDNNTYHSFFVYRNKNNNGNIDVFTGSIQAFKILNSTEILPITDTGYEKPIKISIASDTLHLFQVNYDGDILDWQGLRCDWPIETE